MGDGTAVKITISSYFTPNGRDIHKKGIIPDTVVELPGKDDLEDIEDIKDMYDESGHLKPEYDTQLKEAVSYIKGEIK